MNSSFILQPIGYVESIYQEKFATPRQANLVTSVRSSICFKSPYDNAQAFEGLQLSSHIWVHFIFDQNRDNRWRPRVRPPRCGGNESIGVFATRSPYRPNGLGLSAVRFDGIRSERGKLFLDFLGGDMVHGTPVVDIKPYIPYADCLTEAHSKIAQVTPKTYPVDFSELADKQFSALEDQTLRGQITDILAQDPRPQYHALDDQRIYGAQIGAVQVRWTVMPDKASNIRMRVLEISENVG